VNVALLVMVILDAFVFHQGTPIDNCFEWLMVTTIMAYHGTFIYDWWNVFDVGTELVPAATERELQQKMLETEKTSGLL